MIATEWTQKNLNQRIQEAGFYMMWQYPVTDNHTELVHMEVFFFSIQIKKDYEEKVRNVWHIEKSQSKQGTNRTCQKKRSAFRSRSWSFCDTQNISNYRKLKESVAQGSSLTAWRAKGIRVCVCVCARSKLQLHHHQNILYQWQFHNPTFHIALMSWDEA